MPLDFSITVKARQDPPPSSSPATGLVLPASVASSSAGLLKLLKESGAPRSGGATVTGESSSAFRVVTPKGKFEGRPKQFRLSDVWLTVHRNSVWIRKTNWMSLFVFFISLLIVAQHVEQLSEEK